MTAPYISYLLAQATEKPTNLADATPPEIEDDDVIPFLVKLLRTVDATDGTTRNGIDDMMGSVFAHPTIANALLMDPPTAQTALKEALVLHQASALLNDYWTHIILPAWAAHATYGPIG